MRKGAPVGARRLATPVAIEYVPRSAGAPGTLVVVDDARTVVQLGQDGAISTRTLPSSAAWRELGALGTDSEGGLYVLDSAAQRLLEYPRAGERLEDPPQLLFDAQALPGDTAWQRMAEVLPLQDLYVRTDEGSVRRLDRAGHSLAYDVQPPDRPLAEVTGIAADRTGGLFLADPRNARVLQTTADGGFVRQLRHPMLAGVRELQSSPDGARLYALIPSGVLVLDVPPADRFE
jgi:hypothetical protein